MPIRSTDPCFQEPIAIVGMACRLPGAATLDQYWQLLERGGSAVAELPPERFNERLYFDPRKGVRGKSYSKRAALLADRKFDRENCPIPSSLEASVDNAHLLMCEVAAAACRHAGLDPFNLPLRNTGVYIGHAQGSDLSGDLTFGDCIEEAAQLLRDVPDFKPLAASEQDAIVAELVAAAREGMPTRAADSPDVSIAMVAGTISKAFGLNGPYVALNAACASSLQAIQFAARALQAGRVDMAIAGGASDCKEGSMVLFSGAQTLSATATRPFDNDADGLIISEGYVAIVLKTLSRALADGDPIQAVIPAFGCSSDGKGKSLWAPRKEGQVKAIERAYAGGLDIGTIQFVEAHATSTSLGDATELSALSEVLAGKLSPGKKVPVTSVKGNIGHSLEAAGIAGLIKTVLCMQHRTIVSAINIRTLNKKIDWAAAPIYVPLKNEPWPEQSGGAPRRAAVNAFGIGGLNMHVVVDEFTEGMRADLSARFGLPRKVTKKSGEDDHAVAVIGRGCIFAGAADVPKFWELLQSGRDPKQQAPAGRWRSDLALSRAPGDVGRVPTTLGGYVTDFAYDWKRHKVPPIQVQQADPLQFMLLDATEQVLADAGYDHREFDRSRAAVLVGTESGGDFGTQLCVSLRLPQLEEIIRRLLAKRGLDAQKAGTISTDFSARLLKYWPALVDESGSFSTSTLASRITKTMNFMGGAAAIDAGGASSAVAVAIGVDLLLAGDCDLLVCAGGQRCMNLPKYKAMHLTGALATADRPPSPFDAAASGVVPGEGVGVVLLKRLADARRDGDRIQVIVRGVGLAHAADSGEAWTVAMERALADAGASGADLTLIEADGAGDATIDRSHIQAIGSVVGSRGHRAPIELSAVAGQIGHTVGASAMASLIAATLKVEHGVAPTSFGVTNPLPCIVERSSTVRIISRDQPLDANSDGRRFAAVDSFSKGLAAQIILERGEKVAMKKVVSVPSQNGSTAIALPAAKAADPSAAPSGYTLWRLGAATPDRWLARLQQAIANPAAAFAAAETTRFSATDEPRLAIVAASAEQLSERLQAVVQQVAGAGLAAVSARTALERQGCYYRETPRRAPRVAFLFPGQGSQYAGMLQPLVRDIPAAAAMVHSLDEIFVRHGYPTFEQMAWERPEQMGVDIWITQIALLSADLIVHAAVSSFGIRPDLLAGHSLGEYAALTAAGVWDLEGVVLALRARFESIRATPTAGGALMAVAAPASVIETIASALANRVHIANTNAPDQTIVGGQPAALDALAKLLKARGYQAQMLAVPCAYHTPLLDGAGALLRRSLDALVIRPPRTPMLSSVTNGYVAEPAEIRTNLAEQLTTPVRYIDLVERIANDEDTVLVEVGPQRILTNLHQRIFHETGGRAQTIACDNSKRPGAEQLLHVRALLECLGAIGPDVPTTSAGSPHGVASAPPRIKGQVILVDATEKRRERMHLASLRGNGHSPESAPAARHESRPVESAISQAPSWNAQPPLPVDANRILPTASTSTVAAPAPPAATLSGRSPVELEKFLINFVVEHTGYPPEAIDLDSDLEADLGIDSIKKAQLFAELAEYFDARPTEGMTFDAFPTLRHALDFLSPSSVGVQAPVARASVGTSVDVERPSAATMQVVAPPEHAPAFSHAPAHGDTLDLEKFLVNFVVEQTGYPAEAVDLDSDLEADLGIDSIKKAQLFAELSEYFDARPAAGMTLDDFPTLRHAVNFLDTADAKKKAPGIRDNGAASAAITAAPTPVAATPQLPGLPASTPAIAALPIIRLSGTPYEMGFTHGQQQSTAIRRLLRRFADLADDDGSEAPSAANSGRQRRDQFTPDELDELRGIAAAARVPLDNLLAVNLAIDADRGAEASHAVGLHGQRGQFVHAARYHAPWPAALGECLTPMVSLRCPRNGHPHLALSSAGIVGSLAGINSHGIAVSVTRSRSVRTSRAHAHLAARILIDASDIDSATSIYDLESPVDSASVLVSHWPTQVAKHLGTCATFKPVVTRSSQGESAPPASNETFFEIDAAEQSLSVGFNQSGFSKIALKALWPPATARPAKREIRDDAIALRADATAFRADAPALRELQSNSADQTHRFAMRMKRTPLPESTAEMPTLHGPALVVGDNSAAEALCDRLRSVGAIVHRIEHIGAIEPAIAELERLWRLGPIPHLFLMSDRDLEPLDLHDESGWRERRTRAVDSPLFFAQRWVQLAGEAKLLPHCTIVAVAAMGGDFGFSSELTSPLGGALTGMIKGIYIEVAYLAGNRSMRAKAIDFPDDESPERLAECVCRELAGQTVDYEIGYVGGERSIPIGYPEAIVTRQPRAIRRGGTWVVTGGATGITAQCAMELAKRFDLKLHLIGRSPKPSIDRAWRYLSGDALKELKTGVMRDARSAGGNMDDAWSRVEHDMEIDLCLREFAEAGIDVTYHSCDVSDGVALASVLERIRQTSGPIEGVVHGAGVQRAARFERKQREHVLSTIASKVDGAMNLMRLTWRDPIRHFVGFGSISGRMGSNGQVDYCAASDLLCKLIAWYSDARPGVHAIGFHWHSWSEIGMAAKPETTRAMKSTSGPELMPKHEGVAHFLRELLGGQRQPEVLITDFEYHSRYYKLDESTPTQSAAAHTTSWTPSPVKLIAKRHRLTTVPAPLPAGSPMTPRFNGPVWILGSNPSAVALSQRLIAEGATVHLLPSAASLAETTAAIDELFANHRPRHLFLMTGRHEDPIALLDHDDWRRDRALRVMNPLLAVRRLLRLRRQGGDHSPMTVTAITGLGGDFGLSGQPTSPEGGALCGLLKSLFIEDSRLEHSEGQFKIIDAPLDEPHETLVEAVLQELAADDPHLEVGWSRGRRTIVRSIAEPVESLPHRAERPSGAWIVTGGARGITAAAAEELARRFGVKLHLIGRSPVPRPDALWRDAAPERLAEIKAQIVREAVAEGRPVDAAWEGVRADLEIDQTLKRFAASGIQATYHCCDLADWPKLSAILNQIRRTDGAIEGIVHGAGYGKSGRFDTRPLESIERTLAGKLDGAVALMALTWRDPIKYWIGFGSLSGRFGGNGLGDYAAANDMLAKLIDWYRAQRPDCRACCFHWQSWNEVGMAMLGDSAAGTKNILKMEFLSPREGIEHFCREIEAGLPTGEVLVTDGFFERIFHPLTAPRLDSEMSSITDFPLASSLPLIVSHRSCDGEFGSIATLAFNPAADPFLLDHRFRGKPFLPAVVAMEAMAEATAIGAGKPVTGLRDVQFVTGLRFPTDKIVPARVLTAPEAGGAIECRLVSDFVNRAGVTLQKSRLHVRCLADTAGVSDSGAPFISKPPIDWRIFRYPTDSPMLHGPTLQGLTAMTFEGTRAWGRATALPLSALGGVHRAAAWSTPAVVLDAAFYVCGLYVWLNIEPSASLPTEIAEIRFGRLSRDNESCLVEADFRGIEGRFAKFDFLVQGDDGATIAHVVGYRCQLLGGEP